MRKFDKNEVDIINNEESIDNNEIISLERYDRNVYKDELNSIINQLDLSDINEYNLLEFDFIVGKFSSFTLMLLKTCLNFF